VEATVELDLKFRTPNNFPITVITYSVFDAAAYIAPDGGVEVEIAG
jgi:hypothetical protein